MSIIQSPYTYLIISFILTIFVLVKFGYKKANLVILNEITKIKGLFEDLEKRKVNAEQRLQELELEVELEKDNLAKAKEAIEEESQKIANRTTAEISALIEKQQKEHEEALEKLRTNLSLEIQFKIISLVINKITDKLHEAKNDRYLQNKNINKAEQQLKALIESQKKIIIKYLED